MRPTIRTLIAAGATAALVAAPSAAFAGERPDHAGPSSTDEREWTEDDDTNDGTMNNVEDDGDNAHPSGRDRSVEHGGSGNQGRAQRDPDDDGRGPDRSNDGPDQPGGNGGVDRADQDGNNGCGNDDDFEDDNEGQCLGRQGQRPAAAAAGSRPAAERGSAQGPDTGSRGGADTAPSTSQGGTADTDVTATCPATSVRVTSTKDLSNVVLVFADGDHQRFEGLTGSAGTFAGTGADAGERIVRVYVKSGANASGDGPGYGERHEVTCAAAPASSGVASDTGGSAQTTVDAGRDGQRATPGSPAPTASPTLVGPAPVEAGVLGNVIERPAAPTPVLGAPAGDVIAAGAGVLSAGAPGASAAVGTLPRSGTDTGPAALAGALALLGGILAIRRTRSA